MLARAKHAPARAGARGSRRNPRAQANHYHHHTAGVTFGVKHVPTNFGDHVCLVGGCPALGEWDVLNSIPMDMVNNDDGSVTWTASVEIPARKLVEYKYVVRCGWDAEGPFNWQPGPNNIIATTFPRSQMSIEDQWDAANAFSHDGGDGSLTEAGLAAATAAYVEASKPPPPPPPPPPPEKPTLGAGAAADELAAALAADEEEVEPPPPPPPPPTPPVPPKPEDVWLPEWAQQSVFYHIYPLGFFEAPFENLSHDTPVTPRLAKIREYYDHFEQLGITAIYLSPIFESDTHGYDTLDYFTVDRRLGDNALFKEIVDELHERGIRVVLDGVFNHTGVNHHAFVDLCVNGPAASDYAGWYHVGARTTDYSGWCEVDWDAVDGMANFAHDKHFQAVGRGGARGGEDASKGSSGFAFDCWEGHSSLPRLDHSNRAVREHIFDVARFWLCEMGVDGWRLDVAHEIEPEFWQEFRSVCQAAKPDSVLIGELIHGNYNKWTDNHLLHTGTNYQLQKPIWSSLKDRNYYELKNALLRESALYSRLTLMTFVGNHDVTRITSQVNDRRHVMLAHAFMLFARGIPCMYYGDEILMEGAAIEGSPERDFPLRRPMPEVISDEGKHSLAMTGYLVRVRKSVAALYSGSLEPHDISCTNETLIFTRRFEGQVAVCAFNCSTHEAHDINLTAAGMESGTELVDVMNEGRPVYVLNKHGFAVPKHVYENETGNENEEEKHRNHTIRLNMCSVMCLVSDCPPELAKPGPLMVEATARPAVKPATVTVKSPTEPAAPTAPPTPAPQPQTTAPTAAAPAAAAGAPAAAEPAGGESDASREHRVVVQHVSSKEFEASEELAAQKAKLREENERLRERAKELLGSRWGDLRSP